MTELTPSWQTTRMGRHSTLVGLFALVLGAMGGGASADVLAPANGENLLVGETYAITWDPLGACSMVDIELYRGRAFVALIADDTPDDGSFDWPVGIGARDPGCDFRVRIACPGERVWSQRFAIDGLLLDSVVEGSRTVQLTWSRLPGDTLGAAVAASVDSIGNRAFGGYNVWRHLFDNTLDARAVERFRKIRTYDVRRVATDTIPSAWTFSLDAVRVGRFAVPIDEDEDEFRRVLGAQTFTTPDSTVEVCSVRIFFGRVFPRWDTRVSIVPSSGGVPDFANPIATATRSLGTGGQNSGFAWQSYVFSPAPVLAAASEFAIVLDGDAVNVSDDQLKSVLLNWVHSTYDAFAGGSAAARDGLAGPGSPASWTILPDADFAFVIGRRIGGSCRPWIGQRRGGSFERQFNDPDSILAIVRDEEGELDRIVAQGPFNGFQLRYALTAYDRTRVTSGNVEVPSACEDTLFNDLGLPDAVQPSSAAIWPEFVFPRSSAPEGSPLLRNVYPVPNPYVRVAGHRSFPRWERPGERRIQFFNTPPGALIRIFTVAGDLLRTFRHTLTHGSADWDLRNESGNIVTSGVYIWMVTTDTGETKRGQLVIVR